MTRLDYSLALSFVLSMAGCYGSGAVLDRDDAGVDGAADDVTGDGGGSLPVCTEGRVVTIGDLTATVDATGAVTFHHANPWTLPDPIEVAATLDAVDTRTSTLHLTTPTGAIDVAVAPVELAILEALPLGRAVVARFDRGLILTDAGDGSLLFAVLSVHRTATLDAGPFHFEQRDDACVFAWFAGTTFTCAVGMIERDVEVRADGYTATLGIHHPVDTATIDGRTFSIRLVESRRAATLDEIHLQHPTADSICAVALAEELAVVIGPG